ncbi:c-type cytochrome [Marinicella litoralis]|uniref:Cytochrome c5 n=1 Tax=Marinicella litoralis TaxID=644220 RepID=A0A4R6XTT6_9GAMM|nr:c-type cytochrome [Marinicella litoralis]TDR20863.1 cytochrome c5 [Marinicella litoralis]
MSDQDSIFFRNFSLLLGALVLLTIILALVGISMQNKLVANVQGEADRTSIQESIKPIAAVNTDPNAVTEAAPVVLAAAFDGSLDGEMIYNNVCSACHTTGAGGAPKLIATEWDDRIAQGEETLLLHAIEGYMGENGLMPAKGGRMDLTDEQVQVTVLYMTDNLE